MFFIIRGKLNITNYFAFMVLSTLLLVSVVIGAYLLPHDKSGVALTMAILSAISLGCSMKVISMTLEQPMDE
uniref:hypothetical protein n=1 Tax=Ningiella ruwaisensis TaxID=2364274 RepID=UPI0010A00CCC|nr:hypothetical protein [Ningiella ruwaisensis]